MKNEEDQDFNRKRKYYQDFGDQFDNDYLALALSNNYCYPSSRNRRPPSPSPLPPDSLRPPLSPLQLSSSHTINNPPPQTQSQSHSHPQPQPLPPPPPPPEAVQSAPVVVAPPPPPPRQRVRRNPTQSPREGKSEMVPPPFPWATTHRATVHTLNYLRSKQISTISGDVQCKRCERQYKLDYNLEQKFTDVASFIVKNKYTLHDRAPSVWMNPVLPTCKFCDQENSAKPIISDSKKAINWLFLLLGQMLGCCTLEQLKYFCKHTKNHRTGAKDRVLYLTYLSLCRQLEPTGPFERL